MAFTHAVTIYTENNYITIIIYFLFSFFYYRVQVPPCDASLCAIRAFINPSFSTDADETKLAHIVLERSTAKPVFTHCTCTVGLRKDCSHVGAVLFVLCDIVAEGHEEIPADPTCTEIKCKWSNPKGANCEPKLVEDLHIYKAKFGTEPAAPILWLAFLHTLLICSLKLSLQSTAMPNSIRLSVSAILLFLTIIHVFSVFVH